MAKTSPHKVLYLRVAPQVHTTLAKLAEADRRSITAMAEVLLERYAHLYAQEHLADFELEVTSPGAKVKSEEV